MGKDSTNQSVSTEQSNNTVAAILVNETINVLNLTAFINSTFLNNTSSNVSSVNVTDGSDSQPEQSIQGQKKMVDTSASGSGINSQTAGIVGGATSAGVVVIVAALVAVIVYKK